MNFTESDTLIAIVGIAIGAVLVSPLARGPILGFLRTSFQSSLGLGLVISAPTAARWALPPARSHALDLLLLAIGLAALAALFGAAQHVGVAGELFSDPRSAAAAGLIVAGAAYGVVRFLVAEVVFVVGLGAVLLVAKRLQCGKPTLVSILVVVLLWAAVAVLAEEQADEVLPLTVGAFAGCALAAAGIAALARLARTVGADPLPASWGIAVPVSFVLGAVSGLRWEEGAAITVLFSMVMIGGLLVAFALTRFAGRPGR